MPRGKSAEEMREISKNTRYKKGDPRAIENGRKGNAIKSEIKKVADYLSDRDFDAKAAEVIVRRAESGDLEAVKLYLKIRGQMPSDKVDVNATNKNIDISASAKAIEKLIGDKK